MPYRCLTDIAGPFYDTAKPFRNWSTLPFYQLDLAYPPYVDRKQLAAGVRRALRYLEEVYAQGYTGIVIDNLAHLTTFAHMAGPVYEADSPYRLRALEYRAAYTTLFAAAKQRGMEVFVTTDMQWSTPPLKHYVGQMVSNNSRLVEVNRQAVVELFTALPQVDGIIVRVGEAGGSYNQGTAYTGHMIYTTPESLRGLIDTLLPVCEEHNRWLVVRTWSIGIGELGDVMWEPERYQETFAGYTSPHLLVSTKHTPSDFFRLLPHNPTSGLGGPAQIIEFQNRREYELFGMIPDSVATLHQRAIQHEQGHNSRFAGVWAWNSSGGWGGGRASLGEDGWSIWTELNSAITASLMHDPSLDTDAFIRTWCAERFGGDFGRAVAELVIDSEWVIEQAWYLGPLSHPEQSLGPIYLPSLLWVWWMRPTASVIIWAYLASLVQNETEVLAKGAYACTRLAEHRQRLEELAPIGDHGVAALVSSVQYMQAVLDVAHTLRAFLLRLFRAAWLHKRDRWYELVAQAEEVAASLRHHQHVWGNHPDFPPLELEEVEGFLQMVQHSPGTLWVQTRAACVLVRRFRGGLQTRKHPLPLSKMVAATLLLVAVFSRGRQRMQVASIVLSLFLASPLRQRTLHALLPWANRRFYLIPSIFFEAGPSLKEWTA